MTELQAVNTILMYINEDPIDQATLYLTDASQLPSVLKCKYVLQEVVDSTNATLGTAHLTIDLFDVLLQTYMVREAGVAIYSRTFGFEDKGLEIIERDRLKFIPSVVKYVMSQVFTPTATYDFLYTYIASLLSGLDTLEKVNQIATQLKTRIDSISIPSYLTETKDIEEYKLLVLKLDSDSQVSQAEKDRLFKRLRLITANSSLVGYEYFQSFILSQLKAQELEELEDEISMWKSTIDSLVSTGLEAKMAELLLMFGSDIGKQEEWRLKKEVALDYLASKTGLDYFKSHILIYIKEANTVSEVIAIVDSFEDTINSITVPVNVDSNQYKMSILQLNSGSELGKVEKDLLLRSIVYSNISNIINEAQYDYLKDQVARLVDSSTIGSISDSITLVKSRIASVYVDFTTKYPMLVGNNTLIEYIAEDLKEDGEAKILNKRAKLNSIAKYIYANLADSNLENEEVSRVLMNIPIDKQNINSIDDITNNISTAKYNLEFARKTILTYGWTVNIKDISLYPNTDGYIVIPKTYLSVNPNTPDYTVNDWKLFNNADFTYKFEDAVDVEVMEDIPYDDLVWYLKDFVDKKALYDTYRGIAGASNELVIEKREVDEARVVAVRNDANNQKTNVATSTYVTGITDR